MVVFGVAFGEETLKRALRDKLFESLRGVEFIAIEPHVRGADLKSYASAIGGGDWGLPYALFVYKGSLIALHGVLPSGLYDVMEGRWLWVEGRSYYESIGGVAVDPDTETVAWTSWNTPFMFIYDGSTVKMVDLGEVTGGNIVRGPDGNFYTYSNAGNLYKVTPQGVATRVSTNPNAKGGFCWFAERLGNTIFLATVYPDNSIYAYDVDRASWSVPKPGTTAPQTPWYHVVQPATWETLAFLAVMSWPAPPEQMLGFIAFRGSPPALVTVDYGILPYVVASGDVWNMSLQPLQLDETQTVHSINGILWLVGHPALSLSDVWLPNVRPLGGFFRFTSGISWRGDLYLGTGPLLTDFRGGLLNSDIQRFGGVIRLKRSELFKLQLPPAKAVLWRGKSVSAGEYSLPLVTMGWREVTLYFKSDTPGDLTVEVDPVGDGEWDTYIVRTSTTKEFLTVDEHFARIRLKFSAAATVTASAMLVP